MLAVLLAGSVVTASDYTVIEEVVGDIVKRDGYNVTEDYIEGVRECQVGYDMCKDEVDEAPKRETEGFINGILTGAGGLALLILLL